MPRGALDTPRRTSIPALISDPVGCYRSGLRRPKTGVPNSMAIKPFQHMITSNQGKSSLQFCEISDPLILMTLDNARSFHFPARLDCRYLLHAPETIDERTLLVVTLHGFGMNPEA